MVLDVTRSQDELEKLIKNHQIVIRCEQNRIIKIKYFIYHEFFSLLPYSFHPRIAELCIKYKINMVTASYLTKQMQELHDAYILA